MASRFVTGEAVELDLRPAGLPTRLLATLIDGTLLAVVFVVLGALATQVVVGTSSAGAIALFVTLLLLCFLGLPVTCETVWRGRTPGKAALGLRVVRDDGGPVGFRHAFVRGLLGLVVERPGVSLGVVAVVTSLLHPQGKRLGDLLAGTVVLQERIAGSATARAPVAVMPPALAGWAASLDLSGVPPQLALSVRQFLARSAQLTDSARASLGQQLLDALLATTSPPPPADAPGWAVMSAVLAERRRREEERTSPGPSGAPAAGGYAPVPRPPATATPPPDARPPAAPVARPAAAPDAPPAAGPGGFAPPV